MGFLFARTAYGHIKHGYENGRNFLFQLWITFSKTL